ncbi:hypothetical protein NQ318_015696 [Aromia moschata]|uniref:Uncharacterized protein n=1 Tax=Aromia moschata TaxID=1265417 RepID=A0AAV8YH62_9CUCU|nr:hypothetical protein NQ318_015696 [Aromia moschata]
MNHISVLEIYLDKMLIYYTHIIFKKCKNCYPKIWLNE